MMDKCRDRVPQVSVANDCYSARLGSGKDRKWPRRWQSA